ncbi:MAG TPA: hypothetical protein VFJ58_26980 [Armatimonadota bacterium]|nr:hypothetical protein [Armatimonadota bacterium]
MRQGQRPASVHSELLGFGHQFIQAAMPFGFLLLLEAQQVFEQYTPAWSYQV